MSIRTKRVYDPPAEGDGFRVLVDRLWPRGLRKEAAQVDLWLKDLGPSDELRKWFGHEPQRWDEFRRRYFKELAARQALVLQIVLRARKGTVTLLFGSREEKLNNASALKEYLATSMRKHRAA